MSCLKAMHRPILLVLLSTLAASTAFASPLLVNVFGQFSRTDRPTAFSTPDGVFNLSFNVDSMPAIVGSSADQFDVGYTNFVYKLNGFAIPVDVGSITFFDVWQGGRTVRVLHIRVHTRG